MGQNFLVVPTYRHLEVRLEGYWVLYFWFGPRASMESGIGHGRGGGIQSVCLVFSLKFVKICFKVHFGQILEIYMVPSEI